MSADIRLANPNVFIPVFPGTNCEYDSTKAFERAGANVVTKVFKNLDALTISGSLWKSYKEEIAKAQIVMFPGGFSAGDEPEGSAKFFATVFRNAVIREEIEKLLNERDGLMLGICNGFQALIKLGLVPEGDHHGTESGFPDSGHEHHRTPYFQDGLHQSGDQQVPMAGRKPNWAAYTAIRLPTARDVSWRMRNGLKSCLQNGQVATQYVDEKGNPTMDEFWNPNGSYMAIEGITSPDGRILGKMAHSERRGEAVAMNIYGEQDMKIFESGVKYFK